MPLAPLRFRRDEDLIGYRPSVNVGQVTRRAQANLSTRSPAPAPQRQLFSPRPVIDRINSLGGVGGIASRIYDQFNMVDNNRTFQQRDPIGTASTAQQIANTARNAGTGTGLRGLRSGIGFAEGLTGLYDLATPGTGTNRFSKQLERAGRTVDETARAEGVNTAYQASALPIELLGFKGIGTLAKQGVKYGPKVIIKGVDRYDNAVNRVADRIAKGGKVRQAVGGATRRGLTPADIAYETGFTAKQIGEDAAKGREITPGRVAAEIGIAVPGNIGVQLAAETAGKGARRLANITRQATDKVRFAPTPLGQEGFVQIGRTPKRIHPEDQAVMSDFIDHARGIYKPDPKTAQNLELDAARIAERYGLKMPPTVKGLANVFDQRLQQEQSKKRLLTPLRDNEVGAIGRDVRPKPEETPGISPESAALSQNLPDTSSPSIADAETPAFQAAVDPIRQAPENLPQAGAGEGIVNITADNQAPRITGEPAAGEVSPVSITPASRTAQRISQELDEAVNLARTRNERNILQKNKDALMRTYDPWSEAERLDHLFAVAQGVSLRDLPSEQRLTSALNRTVNARTIAQEKLMTPTETGQSVGDVIQKYGGNSPEGREFVTYLHMRRDARLRSQTGGKEQLFPRYTDEEVNRYVSDYEARNPDAVIDRLTIVAQANADLDKGVGRLYTQADADAAKAFYGDDYVPINRVFSENLLRPEVTGKSIGSIGRQRVLQTLKPGSDLEIDNTFNGIVSRAELVEKQLGQADAARMMLDRSQQGLVPGSELLVGAGNKAARKEMRELVKIANQRGVVPEEVADARQIGRDTIAQLQDDPTTGRQVISGLIDGQPFKLEVPPETAMMLQGLDARKASQIVNWAKTAQRTFQTAWTGFLNVLFPIQSFIFYDVLPSIANSRKGLKTIVSPAAVGEMFQSFRQTDDFQRALRLHGANQNMISGMPIDTKLTAEAIAAQRDIWSKVKFNARHPKELIESLDVIGGKLSNASRTRNARAYYDDAINRGRTHDQAMADAVYAYNNILPNYVRASHLAREINAAIPYFSASISGTRALMQGIRNNPGIALTTIAAGVIAPAVATTAYNLTSNEGEEFYKDMVDSNKQYVLDTNYIIVTPGAHKDPETGEWKGIIKLPISPEFRAVNRSLWRATYDQNSQLATENQLTPQAAALSLFDSVTGGLSQASNPLVDTAKIVAGVNPRSTILNPEKLVKGKLEDASKSEQFYDTTSTAAKLFSKLTGSNISPIQADAMLGQFGLAGRILQNREGNPIKTVAEAGKGRVYGAFGQKNSTIYYDTLGKERRALKDPKDKETFDQIHANADEDGIMDSGEKALLYKNRPKVFEADRRVAREMSRKTGQPVDPVFKLTGNNLDAYLNIQIANAVSPGSPEAKKLKKDNKDWYPAFQAERSAFFERIAARKKDDGRDENKVSVSREILYPDPSPDVSRKLSEFGRITDGRQRAAYTANNPDVTDWFSKYNQYIRDRRDQLKLPQYDRYPEAPPDLQKAMDGYSSLPKGDGPRGGSPTRSAWIKANPGLWQAMTDQWSKVAQYNLQNDAAMAIYEDEDMTEKGIKSIASLARSLGMSGGSGSGRGGFARGGGGRSGGGGTYVPDVNISRGSGYRVKIAQAAPKGAGKKIAQSAKVKVAPARKAPKVRIKKSRA